MNHTITISSSQSKEERYKSLLPQIKSLISGESNMIANLANICSVLKYNMDNFLWVGFYFVRENELIVGPYQGPLACTRIKLYEGVCGASVREKKTVIVEDVNKFSDHIACSPDSKSEIVIPIFENNEIMAVLDVDSDQYSNFDNIDRIYLEQISRLISDDVIPAQAGI